jgi:hypothetical protein
MQFKTGVVRPSVRPSVHPSVPKGPKIKLKIIILEIIVIENIGSYSVNCCFELAGVLLLCFLRGGRFFLLLVVVVVIVVVVVVVGQTSETSSAHDATNFQSGREALSFPALDAACHFGGSKSDRQRSYCFSEDGRISPVDVAYICKLIFVKTAHSVKMTFGWVGF